MNTVQLVGLILCSYSNENYFTAKLLSYHQFPSKIVYSSSAFSTSCQSGLDWAGFNVPPNTL